MKKKLLAFLLAAAMLFSLCACGGGGESTPTDTPATNAPETQQPENPSDDNPATEPGTEDPGADTSAEPEPTFEPVEVTGEAGKYSYNTWTTAISSNWNPHDYEDANSSDQFAYLIDSFYTMAFNDELHPMDDPTRQPYDGYVWIPQMASGMPVDVTAEVAAEHPDWIPEGATSGYAWAIPLRDDLYFDTGYHITAETYVASMQRMLNYDLLNYRSTDVYKNTYGIVGAEAFFKSGQYALSEFVSTNMGDDEYVNPADFTVTEEGTFQVDGKDVVLDINNGGNWGDYKVSDYKGQAECIDRLIAAADNHGWVKLNADLMKDLQDFIAMLHGFENVEAYAEADGSDYPYREFEEMAFFGFVNPEVTYEDTVGYYAKDEYTLVQVFKASCSGFTLFYNAIQDSLILVEPDVYDSCMKKQADGTWTSTYMTSVETSPSYGPYSLTEYQTEKMMHFSKNESWYGYHDDVNHVYVDPNDGQTYQMYQTTDIDLQNLGEGGSGTAKNMFLSGLLVSYGLQATDMDEYRNSDYCYSTPGASIFFMLLTGNMSGLNAREEAEGFDTATEDIQTITCPSFRKAFAVSFDRQAYCDETSPSLSPGYGIFGKTIIYDPATAAYYRDTDVAKKALCDFYSIDTTQYATLDDAVDAITGYDPEAAKELYADAFQESLDAGYITDEDGDGKCDQTINIIYAIGANSISDTMKLRIQWMDTAIGNATVGTPFEGKVHIVASAPLGGGNEWADGLKAGTYDLCLCGWSGSAMDPYNLLQAYTWPSYAYAAAWYEPAQDMLTLTLNGEEITMSVYDWAECVTGNDVMVGEKVYNFGTNNADQETRMLILAGVEGKLLQTFTYIPFANDGSLALLSQKVYYVIEDYNAVMGRGGITYMRYNYDDAEWADYCNEQIAEHGMLQY